VSDLPLHDWLWINGEPSPPRPGSTRGDVTFPATGRPVATVALGGEADIHAAVTAARTAFDTGPWPNTPPHDRARVLHRAHALLTADIDDLTTALTHETGSPVAMGAAPVSLMILTHTADVLEAATIEERIGGMLGLDAMVRRVPVGVVAAIAPWNAPLFLALNKVAPALAAGCTVVLKPDPRTPLDAYLVAEALAAAGLPGGAFNVVPADRETAEALVRHPGVDKVSFTGSTAAGRRIASMCGERIKAVALELGGKSAALVLDDVDLDAHLPLLVAGALLNTGQACAALTRVLVPSSRKDEIVEALVAAVAELALGDPFDPTTFIGPIVGQQHLHHIEDYVALGLSEGARVATGGRRPDRDEGTWYEPTVLVDVDNTMRVAREEIFGPVLAVIAYDGDEEGLRIANDSEYGLGGAVFGADTERAMGLARRIRSGTVGVNSLGIDPAFPFGGFKDSGIGRELGREGLLSYQTTQTIGLPPAWA
jgi:aldehyde dehydrogenase (NAD+)